MKCTDKKYRKSRKRRNRKRELCIRLSCSSALLLTGIIVIMLAILSRNPVTKHEVVTYNTSVHQASLYADELCVTKKDVEFEAFQTKDKFSGALLFDIENQEILYSEKANEKLYPEFAFGGKPTTLGESKLDINITVSKGGKDHGLVGDFENMFKWGFAKQIPLEVIEYGDPDNSEMDLKGYNQVYLRSEVYLGWGILDADSFARVITG